MKKKLLSALICAAVLAVVIPQTLATTYVYKTLQYLPSSGRAYMRSRFDVYNEVIFFDIDDAKLAEIVSIWGTDTFATPFADWQSGAYLKITVAVIHGPIVPCTVVLV